MKFDIYNQHTHEIWHADSVTFEYACRKLGWQPDHCIPWVKSRPLADRNKCSINKGG